MQLTNYEPVNEITGKVRYESFLRANMDIPTKYDSLVAKLIVHENNREQAIEAMLSQLELLTIEGFPTTKELFKEILKEEYFVKGAHKTNYISLFMADLTEKLLYQ